MIKELPSAMLITIVNITISIIINAIWGFEQ